MSVEGDLWVVETDWIAIGGDEPGRVPEELEQKINKLFGGRVTYYFNRSTKIAAVMSLEEFRQPYLFTARLMSTTDSGAVWNMLTDLFGDNWTPGTTEWHAQVVSSKYDSSLMMLIITANKLGAGTLIDVRKKPVSENMFKALQLLGRCVAEQLNEAGAETDCYFTEERLLPGGWTRDGWKIHRQLVLTRVVVHGWQLGDVPEAEIKVVMLTREGKIYLSYQDPVTPDTLTLVHKPTRLAWRHFYLNLSFDQVEAMLRRLADRFNVLDTLR